MGDINFLSDQKGGSKNKDRQRKEKRVIKWTEPAREKKPFNIKYKPEKRGNFADFFNLFKRNKISSEAKEEKNKGFLGEKDIDLKRKEVLDFIKKSEEPILKKEEKKQAFDFNKSSAFLRGAQHRKKYFFKSHSSSPQAMDNSEKALDKVIPEKKKNAFKINFWNKLTDSWRAYLERMKKAREEKERIKKAKREKERAEKKIVSTVKPVEKEILSEKKEIKYPPAPIIPKSVVQKEVKHTPIFSTGISRAATPQKKFEFSFFNKLIGRWRAYLGKIKQEREEKEKRKKAKKEQEEANKKIVPTVKPAEKEILPEKKEIKNIPAPIAPLPATESHKKEEHKGEGLKGAIREKIEKITPSILGTNLIEGEISAYFNWRKNAVILILWLIFACLFVGSSYAGVIYWEKKERAGIKSGKLDEINKEIARLEGFAEKIKTIEEKSLLVEELLNNHIYWTNFFKFLENNTLKKIYYVSGFSGGTDGTYSLSAKAPNFQTIYDQVNVLNKNKDVLSAGVDGGSLSAPEGKTEEEKEPSASEISFQLDLKINPNIFIK